MTWPPAEPTQPKSDGEPEVQPLPRRTPRAQYDSIWNRPGGEPEARPQPPAGAWGNASAGATGQSSPFAGATGQSSPFAAQQAAEMPTVAAPTVAEPTLAAPAVAAEPPAIAVQPPAIAVQPPVVADRPPTGVRPLNFADPRPSAEPSAVGGPDVAVAGAPEVSLWGQPRADGERVVRPSATAAWSQRRAAEPAAPAWGHQVAAGEPPADPWAQQTVATPPPASGWDRTGQGSPSVERWVSQPVEAQSPVPSGERLPVAGEPDASAWGRQTPAQAPADAWGRQTPAQAPADAWGRQTPAQAPADVWVQQAAAEAPIDPWAQQTTAVPPPTAPTASAAPTAPAAWPASSAVPPVPTTTASAAGEADFLTSAPQAGSAGQARFADWSGSAGPSPAYSGAPGAAYPDASAAAYPGAPGAAYPGAPGADYSGATAGYPPAWPGTGAPAGAGPVPGAGSFDAAMVAGAATGVPASGSSYPGLPGQGGNTSGARHPAGGYPGAGGPEYLGSEPKKRRTGVLVGAVAGVLVLVGAAGFGVTKLAGKLTSDTTTVAQTPAPRASTPSAAAPDPTPTDAPTTIVKQSAVPLAAGQTRVVDKADGLTFVLPKGWTQAPTSPKQMVAWMKKAQTRNPNLKSMSAQQLSAVASNVAVFAVYTGARSAQDLEYMMVMRSPVAMPPITAEAVPAIQAGMAKTPGLQGVQCRLTTVAGAPAVRATMQTKVATAAGTVRLNATAYVVNSPTVNGLFAYFYTRAPGDPRGDMAAVMSTFDPNYTG